MVYHNAFTPSGEAVTVHVSAPRISPHWSIHCRRCCLLLSLAPVRRATASADSRIEVLLDEPLGTISPNIYGHFTEHLGGVIYDGVWVGENSPVPNVNGIRKRLVEELRKIKAPVVRYPGGCFADSYNWRDGVGPADQRPRRTNFWADAESANPPRQSQIRTQPFRHQRIRALLPPRWRSALSRRQSPQPHRRRFLSLGGILQFARGQHHARGTARCRRFARTVRRALLGRGQRILGLRRQFHAAGIRRGVSPLRHLGSALWPGVVARSPPVPTPFTWLGHAVSSKNCSARAPASSIPSTALSLHHYAWNLSRGRTADWEKGKGSALEFAPVDWYELLREGQRIEELIEGHWHIMGEFDDKHRVKLIVDEWGPWYRPGSEATPGRPAASRSPRCATRFSPP